MLPMNCELQRRQIEFEFIGVIITSGRFLKKEDRFNKRLFLMFFREITSLLGKWTVSYMMNRSGVMVCIGLNGCFCLETTLQMKPLTILTRFGVDGGKSVALCRNFQKNSERGCQHG